jgi:hypothetical protein
MQLKYKWQTSLIVALGLFVGRDPAIEAAKRARRAMERGEQVEERVPVMSA